MMTRDQHPVVVHTYGRTSGVYWWHFITGHSVGGGALFITIKAAQWCFEANKAWLLSCENTWIADRAGKFSGLVLKGDKIILLCSSCRFLSFQGLWHFFPNVCTVVFSSVTTFSSTFSTWNVTSVTYNQMPQIKITDRAILSVRRSGIKDNRWFSAGGPTFKELKLRPVKLDGKAVLYSLSAFESYIYMSKCREIHRCMMIDFWTAGWRWGAGPP